MAISQSIDALSYALMLNDRQQFKRSGTSTGSDFNIYDTPGHKYFKLLFYFTGRSEEEVDVSYSAGLLAPSWELELDESNYYTSTSAWAYLKMNDENERAEKLKRFVTLLSNINSQSPWYFSSVSGIDGALERKSTMEGKFDVGETKKLQIKCLPDAFDNRIATLLELYRDIVWSWNMKREIIPSNLRKFDMAIYIYESQVNGLLRDEDVIDGNSGFKPSYKMIEFHNCEFDYNSIKSGYSEISNQTGVNPTFTIDINYDDAYEISYNSIMMRTIGDVISTDTMTAVLKDGDNTRDFSSKEQEDDNQQMDIYKKRLEEYWPTLISQLQGDINNNIYPEPVPSTFEFDNNIYGKKKRLLDLGDSFVGNALEQVAGKFVGDVKSKLTKAILGNLYTFSLTKLKDQAKSLMKGDVIAAAQSVKQYIKDAEQRKAARNKQPAEGNIYNSVGGWTRVKPEGDIYPNDVPKREKTSGNIFNKSTIANN
jgi:hypothetical protein